ncbi:hypothetical protein KIN20_033471 [Parelaphostrongylus tenuis]|uniref:Uncharacterized protein n=1 Tax=Parelaphostrongylus tenuis TaxID=148309 RepID=A0AAD5R8M8_PARTN|nr:hypothetical protein KIN20_033471 [Parelaphostrongylus tenuis]
MEPAATRFMNSILMLIPAHRLCGESALVSVQLRVHFSSRKAIMIIDYMPEISGTFVNVSSFSDVSKTCPKKKCQNPASITDPVIKHLCNTSYTWDVFSDYDIFKVNKFGNIAQQLTEHPGYDAEAVLSPDGKLIAFTSIRSGDLDLWIMDSDGADLRQGDYSPKMPY